jgi:hypothetical protein
LPKEPIQLMRSPRETKCCNRECGAAISFGAYAYVNSDTNEALCLECGVKRGLSSKDRAKQIVAYLELREDIKVLKDEKKVQGDALVMLKQQVDLFRLGERDLDLEKSILSLSKLASDYLRSNLASDEEKAALQQLLGAVEDAREMQREIRDQVERRLFWLKSAESQVKKRKPIAQEAAAV